MIITLIAGARPNFMKIAPIIHAIHQAQSAGSNIQYRLVHTGQHYDKNMSDSFFEELNIPAPHANLECGGGTQAEQTGAVMVAFEKELIAHPADLVMVVGDVTSTMACSIVAKKLNIKVAHVEAGIRSGDMSMPEEINRIVTDSITDYFFTTSDVANRNLIRKGVDKNYIFYVGNVMIDTLLANKTKFKKPAVFDEIGLKNKEYFVLTMHRPANVDEASTLKTLMDELVGNVRDLPIVFAIHPRTARIFTELGIQAANLHIVDPMSYLEFNYLVSNCKGVITDSGGITEETSVMGIPCITLRNNTERPETIDFGTNELIGNKPEAIKPALEKLFNGDWKKGGEIYLWDGRAAQRIVETLMTL